MLTRNASMMTGWLLAGGLMTGAAAPWAGAAIWKANDFEGGSSWFTGASLTQDQAHSPTHSVTFGAGSAPREYKPFADMPTLQAGESFGSFLFSVWVFDNDDAQQSYQRAVRFIRSDNTGEDTGYTSTGYNAIGAGWTQLTFDFTSEANQAYADGQTRISRAYIRAYSPGTLAPYYVDDAELSYTIIPEPASLALLGLGGAVMIGRRRRRSTVEAFGCIGRV